MNSGISRQGLAILAVVPVILTLRRLYLRSRRVLKVAKIDERVLVLGASSGIGRSIANLYAERGARVCVVGRRRDKIEEVAEECRARGTLSSAYGPTRIIGVAADFADVEDMVRLRDTLETEWQGVDTVIVAAGVSALQPLMAIAGLEAHSNGSKFTPSKASKEGIQKAVDITAAATRGNYVGPLIAAITFIPLLTTSSVAPSILLVSSLAALIPAPTRTLYASTKAASLVLYQALSIEHPTVNFTFFTPSTVDGDFRASAVDAGPVREADPNKHGLKKEDVALRCIEAVDTYEKTVFMPGVMRFGHLLYWIWPAFVEWRARKKYNFSATVNISAQQRSVRQSNEPGARIFHYPAHKAADLTLSAGLLLLPHNMLVARPVRRLLGRPSVVSYFHTTPAYWAARKVIQKFKLADIGEGITESVQPAAKISAFDPLCEVQSDKASVEITSPFDGIIKELLVQEGEVAKVGAGLCLIEVDEEAVDGVEEPAAEATAPTPAPAPASQPEAATTPPAAAVERKPEAERRLHPLDPNFTPTSTATGAGENVFAAPSVRHFARQKGVDLARLAPGSGKGGRIEKSDVEAHLVRPAAPPTTQQQPLMAAAADLGQDVVVELGRTRYGMWKAMEKSLEIPHFGYSTTLDLTALHQLLPTLNAHIPGHFLHTPPKTSSSAVNPSALYPAPTPGPVSPSQQYNRLTYLPILLKTLSRAMLEWPLLRASITPTSPSPSTSTPSAKPTLTIRPHADISIALSTPTGLYTPTLTSVDASSIYALASRLSHLAHLGRQVPTALTPKEMPKRGGTITVSNVGAIGAGEFAAPVLVPGGGVAIVALGRAKWVWDVDGVFGEKGGERRLKMGVSWSADHRVVEGAELAAFVESWRGWVERPERLIGEGV
ncbi:hypothetical protein D9615_007287 [Tricholomella constricta]|uniref:Dihydrolipoamide acetyltransferase component of pyruvate dehydrogenase complex n=1 Tax=Tricholomella constricta TaxID=117010 RepID=A0A8H5H540_9AGAR|nr:hypothetical protein D9615_007287 [Tricholomella constricta]